MTRVAPRVLHISQPTDAGVARYVIEHARRQAAAGWQVHLACPPDGWLSHDARAAGLTVHEWPARRDPTRGVYGEVAALGPVVRRSRPDLVHLHSSKAGLDGRLRLRGHVPTLFSPNAWSFEAVHGPAALAARSWERFAARWTTRIVSVSEDERSRGHAIGIRAPYEMVPNGVDLAVHRMTSGADRAAARAALDVGPEAPLAVCVGRLSEQKGQDLLLQAWPAVSERLAEAILVLVGDGPDAGTLRQSAPDGVIFTGAVADPRAWLAAANVVVVPSRWEGMAFVPLEAMATGRSVVAFAATGVQESIPARAGEVVPPGSVAGLADAICRRLVDRDAADREGRAGRVHVERAHDIDILAGRMLDIYQRVLTGRPGATPPDGASSTSPNSH
jgi:glycosyltransferase involved in cell wall biosynthesis